MKKIYNTPEMLVTKINPLTIIATSDPQVNPEATEGEGGWGDAQSKQRGPVDFSQDNSWE